MPPLLFFGLKAFRLDAKDYPAVLTEGESLAANSCVMRVLAHSGQGKTRLGVVTGKKSLRRAVDRARARRLLREAFRLIRPQLKPGYDMVLIARWKIANQSCQAVQRDLLYLCRKAKLLLPQPGAQQ